MARNVGTAIQNSLVRGWITEATGLNYPDDAVTEGANCKFEQTGKVVRRLGIDVEGQAETMTPSPESGVIKEFIWQAVFKTGGRTFLALQTGTSVSFFELTLSPALSQGLVPSGIDLRLFSAPGATDIRNIPCSFASGNGFLFIAHPLTDPVIIRWNDNEQTFQAARVRILTRDFEGVEDSLKIDENPDILTSAHHYNLRNQGWNREVRVGEANNEAGTGGPLPGQQPPPVSLDWQNI